MATDATFAPWESFAADNKTIEGFDIDVVNAAFAKMGLTVEIVNVGFDSIITGVQAGRYDLAASAMNIKPARLEVVDMVAYFQGGSAIAVAQGNPKGLQMSAPTLCGDTLATESGSVQAADQGPALSKECTDAGKPAIQIQVFPSTDDAIVALTSGRVDGVFSGRDALTTVAAKSNGAMEIAPGPLYAPTQEGVAFPKGSPITAAFDAAVRALYADGTMKTLADKWGLPAAELLSE
jgi:polar amino acid transport system substrate-binding protein